MELLKRALLLGCLLPGLWLLRLTPLEPLITIVPVESSAPELASPAEPPLVASGTPLGALLSDIDALAADREPPDLRWRMTNEAPRHGFKPRSIFFRQDEKPVRAIADRLAGRESFLLVNSAGNHYYRVDRLTFTREDFRPLSGFVGSPAPPSSILYPFQVVGLALILAGFGLFLLLPHGASGVKGADVALLLATAVLFAGPLFLVGGSVQALSRWPWITVPSWALAAAAMHLFASPQRNVRLTLHPSAEGFAAGADAPPLRSVVRVGFAFLALAIGPATVLVASSFALWNR